MGTLIFGGVFERFPDLKVVCVEADAGWVPHYMYRMDHAYNRHRNWMAPRINLSRLPSEYFAGLSVEQRTAILGGNVAELYNIDVAALTT